MELSTSQHQAVVCLKNCLVVACPGSGKTRVLIEKCKHIFSVHPAARILIVTFTSDSAKEIRKRVLDDKDGVGRQFEKQVASGTFHSLALSQIKLQTGFNGTIIGQGQMEQYIERALAECKLFDFTLDEAVSVIESCKATPGYMPTNDNHGRLYQAYADLTERNNVIDFTDMLSRAVRMMSENEIEPKGCDYIMIDEAQDLDELQYAWAREHIRDREFPRKREGSIFTVVGDDDQSIYKFRRALGYAGMMRFKDEFDAELITMDINYRCHSEILGSASKLIINNETRVDKRLEAARGAGGDASAYLFSSPSDETEAVVKMIRQECADNPIPPPYKYSLQQKDKTVVEMEYVFLTGVQHDEWAILARNNHNLRMIASELKANGIPCRFNGTDIWGDRPVCLAIALLEAIVSKKKAGFDAALHFAGISDSTLKEMHVEFGENFLTLFKGNHNLSRYGKGAEAIISGFREQIINGEKAISKNKEHRTNNAIRGVFNWFINNLPPSSTEKNSKGKNDNSHALNKRKLESGRDILCRMKGDHSLTERIKRVTSKPEPPDKESKFGAVFLGTLHSSKGLEFKNVWLLSMSEGVIPDLKEYSPETHDEERRLFYVGMTRAKNTLTISAINNPSSFITETKIELLDGTIVLKPDSPE